MVDFCSVICNVGIVLNKSDEEGAELEADPLTLPLNINVPNPIYSHSCWNVTQSMRLWIKMAKKMVAGSSLRARVRSSVVLEKLGVKLTILFIRRGKLS